MDRRILCANMSGNTNKRRYFGAFLFGFLRRFLGMELNPSATHALRYG